MGEECRCIGGYEFQDVGLNSMTTTMTVAGTTHTHMCLHTHGILHIPAITMLMSNHRPPLTCRPRTPPPPHSCSESGLQFVPLPYTSLFKMTLLHFMVNQLFCLTQSAGSASQPARLDWGAWGRGRAGGWG